MTGTVKRFTERLRERHTRNISIVAKPTAPRDPQPATSLRVHWAEETPPIPLPFQRVSPAADPPV